MSRTCSGRTTSTAADRIRNVGAALALLLVATPAPAATPRLPAVTEVLAAYERATRADDVRTLETTGIVSGEGLTGAFHTWRDGDRERDDENLGLRSETTLRNGTRAWVRNANGNVRELAGILKRRGITAEFIDSGAFLKQPARSKVLGFGEVGGTRVWRLEVNAPGGEPEILWIDPESGLPRRTEVVDGDGPTYVDLSDWRTVAGRRFPFRDVSTDGNHEFDVVEQTTSIVVDGPIPPDTFAPLVARTIVANGVISVPLISFPDGHIGCSVTIAGKPATFIVDSGAQSVLLDKAVATAAGLDVSGALEVRGAGRSGGLGIAKLGRLGIGSAHLDDLVVSVLDLGPSIGPLNHVSGILGYPFFAAAQVELDFAHHVMRFGVPGSFAPRGTKIAVDIDREIPEAMVRLDNRLDAPFLVDTGNSGEMLLYRPFVDAHPGFAPFNTDAALNYGIGGVNRTYRAQLATVTLAGFELYQRRTDVVLADQGAFADRVDAGNIGLGVLRNFVTTFDLTNATMYFARGDDFDDGRRRPAMRG